tara:strand:+ start:1723 stop:2379 length:657 start_codon:yes stop_codon:yes gene_type:complete
MKLLVKKELIQAIKVISIITIFVLISISIHNYGLTALREKSSEIGFPIFFILFALRSSSIIFPALPSTGYSILAGLLLGFTNGYLLICIADLMSCSISFYLSKTYGKRVLNKITTPGLVIKIEDFSKKHFEGKYLLITAFLMTGFFDFVSYALGLTKIKWEKYIPCLIISVGLSNIPIVALGSGLMDNGKRILVVAVIGLLILSYITRKLKISNKLSK